MTNRIIVGLAGLKGSGKDTAAQALIEDGFVVLKFADGLKNMLRALFKTAGVNKEDTEQWVEGAWKEVDTPILRGKSPRFAMQTLGTEWGRNMIGSDLWTYIFENALLSTTKNVVVTDLRFPNELQILQNYKAKLFRVERGLVNTDLHESEKYIMEINIPVIKNDGSIEDLHKKIRDAISS